MWSDIRTLFASLITMIVICSVFAHYDAPTNTMTMTVFLGVPTLVGLVMLQISWSKE